MNPSRWREIVDLFHAALEQDPAARDRLLSEVEARDPALAQEVRSLLRSHATAEGFLARPAWSVAPELLAEPHVSLVGRQIGSYRVTEEIGRGGMGVVYAALDERLRRTVALKALPSEYTRDPARRERLKREAIAAAALSHPSVATVFALEEIDGDLYIVSELVRGRTLRDELRDGPLPASQLLPTLIAIASALQAAHAIGIVHRDLKPENIVRATDGQVKVLDFGLARWEPGADAPSMTRLTEAGVALGTPGYMAPEQLSGAPSDARSDLFSFGVLSWELATGEHPFGTDPGAVLARMTDLMEGRATALSRPLPYPGLDRIARRCMRGSPADRYATATALIEDLRSVQSSPAAGEIAAASDPPPRALWWWQFHQASMAVLDAATPVLALLVRQSIRPPHGRWIFFAILALATIAVTLRLNLLFTARVHPATLIAHRARLFAAIAGSESMLAALLFGSALMLTGTSDATAAPLLSLALVLVASLAIIEPATTAGAGLTRPRRAVQKESVE